VIQGVEIGAGAVVGAGAAVVRDIHPGARVAGVPARPLRDTEPSSEARR
jgi:acetyltransferase-like isoleucine patch superfamily enzyme